MITFNQLGSFGRLGNQLFQIATTVALAKRHNDEAIFPQWSYNSCFKNPINDGLKPGMGFTDLPERQFHYEPINYKPGINLLGYYQSEKYFIDQEDIIRNQFDFRDNLIGSHWDDVQKHCSIHVRRTDYLKLKEYHPFPGMEYYNQAIHMMKGEGCTNFLVFSDDIPWCKTVFPSDFIFVEGQNNIQDLCLMSKCGNHIIANSSFSWWGAWLNANPFKTVIAPRVWFGPANPAITKDIYCPGWLVI